MYELAEDMRRAEYLSRKLPAAGLEADVAELIERHLDVMVDLDRHGEPYSDVDGVEQAALAIVEMLRSRGMVT